MGLSRLLPLLELALLPPREELPRLPPLDLRGATPEEDGRPDERASATSVAVPSATTNSRAIFIDCVPKSCVCSRGPGCDCGGKILRQEKRNYDEKQHAIDFVKQRVSEDNTNQVQPDSSYLLQLPVNLSVEILECE